MQSILLDVTSFSFLFCYFVDRILLHLAVKIERVYNMKKIKSNPQDKEKDPNLYLVSRLYNNGLLCWDNYKGIGFELDTVAQCDCPALGQIIEWSGTNRHYGNLI